MTALATAMIVAMTPLTGVQAAVTPEQAIAVGIDVSKYQGLIDWAQVKASPLSRSAALRAWIPMRIII